MPSISRTWTFSSVSTRAFIASVSTALCGRQGLPQPLGLPVVLGPAAHSMLAWLRLSTVLGDEHLLDDLGGLDTTASGTIQVSGGPQHPDDVEVASFPARIAGVPTMITPLPRPINFERSC